MSWQSVLFFLFVLTSPLFSKFDEVGVVDEVVGNVTIKPAQMDILPGVAISGRALHDGDIIHSSEDGKIKFNLSENGNNITMSGLSELRIDFENQTYQLKLNYGNIFTEFSNDTNTDCYVITHSSRIKLDEGELWITRNITENVQVYVIKGSTKIIAPKVLEQHIEMGEMFVLKKDGDVELNKISEDMLPTKIFQQLENNRQWEKEEKSFTVMNYFTDDSSIAQAFQEKKIRPFSFTLETGAVALEKAQYAKVSLLLMYTNKYLKFGYGLAGFIGVSDTTERFNTFLTQNNILAPLFFDYRSSNGNYQLKLGRISNLTFGYGMLLKRYTNTISYPVKQDGGLIFDFQSDAKNYTYQLFISSIGELAKSGGLIGMYGTAVISSIKSLRIGAGFVYDLNQFSSVDDTWVIDSSPKSIRGYQVDFTYELKSSLQNDTYLFGEFTKLIYTDSLRYIKSESENGNAIAKRFDRPSSFGFLGPGIWWKLGHYRDIKIAFNYSSALHITPFFGETYNLERVHYVPGSVLDSINNTEPYSQFEEWNNMITENRIDTNFTAYYLPKNVYALLDPTHNVHNKVGLSVEYSYHYRNYYQYSFDISMFQETEVVESPDTYYTFGMDFSINDGLIHGISECSLYFNQYFTSELFNTSTYSENMVFGAALGMKISRNVSFRIYRNDVFYDRNLDGVVNINSTMGIDLVAQF